VLVGALSAASARLVLAKMSRRFRSRLSTERRDQLEAARQIFAGSRAKGFAALGLFALSPVPSAQLFVAAGLLDVALIPLTAAFFAGRLISYSLYVSAASLADRNFGDALRNSLTSHLGIALQLLMLAGLVALVRVDWVRITRWAAGRKERKRDRHRAEVK
jgi:uncharacterized membrane protein YdjX (TVP38/TMEM64 family)